MATDNQNAEGGRMVKNRYVPRQLFVNMYDCTPFY
jgi:hypothetical protein